MSSQELTWEVGEQVLVSSRDLGGRRISEATVTAIRGFGAGKRTKVTTTAGVFDASGSRWERGSWSSSWLRKRDAEGLAMLAAYHDHCVVQRFKASRSSLTPDQVTRLAVVLRELGLENVP